MNHEGSEFGDDAGGTTGGEGSTDDTSLTALGPDQAYTAEDQPPNSRGLGNGSEESETRSAVPRDERSRKTLSKFSDSSSEGSEESQNDDSTTQQPRDEESEKRGFSESEPAQPHDEATTTMKHEQNAISPTTQSLPKESRHDLRVYLTPTQVQINNEQKAKEDKAKAESISIPQSPDPTHTSEKNDKAQLPYGGSRGEIFRREYSGHNADYANPKEANIKRKNAPEKRRDALKKRIPSSLHDPVSADELPAEEEPAGDVCKDLDGVFGDQQDKDEPEDIERDDDEREGDEKDGDESDNDEQDDGEQDGPNRNAATDSISEASSRQEVPEGLHQDAPVEGQEVQYTSVVEDPSSVTPAADGESEPFENAVDDGALSQEQIVEEFRDSTSNDDQASEPPLPAKRLTWEKLIKLPLGDPFDENSDENLNVALQPTSTSNAPPSDDNEQRPTVSSVSTEADREPDADTGLGDTNGESINLRDELPFFAQQKPDSAAKSAHEYSRPFTPLNSGQSGRFPPSGDGESGNITEQYDNAESSLTSLGISTDGPAESDSATQQTQNTGSSTGDANEEGQDPSTPDSAKEIELMSGMSIAEGYTKTAELENQTAQIKTQPVDIDPAKAHIKTPHPNPARDLEMQRQILKARENGHAVVERIQHGNGIEEFKAQRDYAFAKAHEYRYQRDQNYYKLFYQERWAREETGTQYKKRRAAEELLKTARKQRDMWEKAFRANKELAWIERERRLRHESGEDGMEDRGVQTDDLEVRNFTSRTLTDQTPPPSDIQMTDPETQIDVNSAVVAQPPVRVVRQRSIPSPPIQWPREIRPQLVEHLVESINDSHQQLRGAEITALTEERLETLLGNGETTFDQLVLALDQDGFTFRPDHLAQEIERFIRPHGRVPAGVLIAALRFSNIDEAVTRLLEEIADTQFQFEINEAERKRAGYQAPAPSNGQTVEEYERQQGEVAALAMQLDEYEERCEKDKADIEAWEAANANLANEGAKFFDENERLKNAVEELESTVKELSEQRILSPPESSPKADQDECDALKTQRGECRRHGEQIEAKYLQLSDDKAEPKRMDEELDAITHEFRLQIEDLKRKLADCEAANWELIQKQPAPLLDAEEAEAETSSEKEVPEDKKSKAQLLAIIAALRSDIVSLREENKRWQRLLTQIQTYNQQQEAREAEAKATLRRSIAATNSIVTALPTPAIALPPETPDMLGPTPSALPPLHGPKAPFMLRTPTRWQERERQIGNTAAWRRTRDAIRRQMRVQEDWDDAGEAASFELQEDRHRGLGMEV